MAIAPKDRYPGQVDTSDPVGYPQGAARNVGSPGDGTGTPWDEDLVNDWFGFFQSLLDAGSLTPSATPDKVGASQYLDGLKEVVGDYGKGTSRTVLISALDGEDGENSADRSWRAIGSGVRAMINGAIRQVNLSNHLPNGAVITAVRALVKPSAAFVSGTQMELLVTTHDFSAFVASGPSPAVDGPDGDDGTANRQYLELTGLSRTVDRQTGTLVAQVTARSDNGAGDDLYALEVTYDDPGLRQEVSP